MISHFAEHLQENFIMKFAMSALLVAGLVAASGANAQAHNHGDHAASPATAPRPAAVTVEKAAPNAKLKGEFAATDRNNDGKLTRREMVKHPMISHFKMMDVNGDGYISFAEYTRKH